MKRPIVLALAALALLSVPVAAERTPHAGDDADNVRLTLVLAGVKGASDHRITALLLDGERARITTGRRVPTPTVTAGTPDEGAPAATAIQYQDVGLDIVLHGRVVGPERVRVKGEVDLSSIVRDPATPAGTRGAPTVATFRHVFDVILADGVLTVLAEAPDPDGGSATLTLTAEIQD